MKISVVVPSFNQAIYLRACLESVLTQADADVELLVFDGGSTDGSAEILREYKGRCFSVSRRDRGQADAINQGLRRARGDILAYLNSDDVYLPGVLEIVRRHFRDHPRSLAAYGRAHHLRADGSHLEDYPTEPWNYARLLETCYICQPAVFWRRELIERFGVFDPELHYAMDYEYWLRAGRVQAFDYLEREAPLAGSRLHDQTKTLGARVKVHREILRVIQHYAASPAPVHRWLRHLAHYRAEEQVPTRPDAAARRAFVVRWTGHLLLYAREFGIPVDAALRESMEPHLASVGI